MPADLSWFVRDRFGLFVHWGLYALPARHEWVKANERLTDEQYDAYFRHFDPDLFDPAAWAAAAADAGMRYAVVTTKHHDGFCLWDTKLTDYSAPHTPAGRDLLRPMLDAFRQRQLRVGLYHSLIDWHHPDFTVDPHVGPRRDAADRAAINAGRDMGRYADYLHGQVGELLGGDYGPIDITWFDFSYPKPDGTGKGRADWRSEQLVELVRRLQPNTILNDRLDLPGSADVKTPEQFVPRRGVTVDGRPVVWEACHTFGGSWGYHRDERSWKSVDQLVRLLIDTVSKGGNLLLNVGPTGRGEFDRRTLDRLAGIGRWMRRHGRSIYGCGPAPAELPCPADCRLTYDAVRRRCYVHVFAWPFVELHLDGWPAGAVAYAQLLNDASEVKAEPRPAWQADHSGDADAAGVLTLRLPVERPDVTVPVVELFLA